jgi:drug/metabolite transporter (DMT)-like permease
MVSASVKADLLLILATLLAACGWVFSKESLIGLPPILFIGLRFLLAGAVLVLLGLKGLRRVSLRDLKMAGGTGLIFAVAMMSWISGLQHTSHLGEGAFITSMSVVLVPVIGRIFFAEVLSREIRIALPISVLGLMFLSLEKGFSLAAGQLYFIASATLFAVHFNLVSKLVARISPLVLTATQLVIVGGSALLISVFLESWPVSVATNIWGWFLASALIATSLRFWLQTKAQSFTSASHAIVIMTLEPIWTALLAGVWFAETMTVMQIIGCSLIFSALLVSRWRWLKAMLIK